MSALLVVHAAATFFMCGVIWYTQIDHYPLFGDVGHDRFGPYQARNVKRTAVVVIPPMLVELGTGLALPHAGLGPAGSRLAWAGVALLAILWINTVFVAGPQNVELGRHWDDALWRRLLVANGIRTACWTLRGLLVGWLLLSVR